MIQRHYKRLLLTILIFVLVGSAAIQAIGARNRAVSAGQAAINSIVSDSLEQLAAPPGTNKTTVPQGISQQPEKRPAEQILSRRITEYHIQVQLLPEERLLLGNQTVTWTNPGKKPVSELYFHLYANAFQSDKSSFMQESGGKLRGIGMKQGQYGGITLSKLTTENGADLLQHVKYVQPDDGNESDHTLIKVRLPQWVPPQGSITLQLAYDVKLPAAFARMGYATDFYMAGQWFPKLAVYEPAGTRSRPDEGWNLHQYHGNSEFYADFGTYNVKITVPAAYKVAATGFMTEANAVTANQQRTYHYYADDVHDFAWAASPNFIYAEEPFSAPNVPGVKIKLYLDPLHQGLQDRYFRAAKAALANFSKWYGAYPYSTLSIVIPPADGEGAGGMEYPTLVTGLAAASNQPGLELERTVIHEIAHQYWYGMVASNEFEEAWLDEGFASYSEDKAMEAEYDASVNQQLEASYMTNPAPLKQLSWSYRSASHYADNVYTRAKLVLLGIEQQIGPKQMRQLLRTYFVKWRFKHPTTADFQHAVEQVTRTDWGPYFKQYVYSGLTADFAVDSIQTKPTASDGQDMYENVVVVSKRGGTYAHIPIQFTFQDGTTIKKLWDNKNDTMTYKLFHSAPLIWVDVDPEHSNPLDNHQINNFMKASVDPKTAVRWSLSIAKILEIALSAAGW